MFKQLFLFLSIITIYKSGIAQHLYAERFNNLALTPIVVSSQTVSAFTNVPNAMQIINSVNRIADTLTGNYPYRVAFQNTKTWLAFNKPSVIADTFAVSTSWFNPVGVADAWLITPKITGITATSVLNWEAMSADVSNLENYEVYVTTDTASVLTAANFTSNNKVANIVSENYTWNKRGVSLGVYAGQTIRIAFRHTSSNKFQLWLDDIVVENNTNAAFDVSATNFNTYKYATVNSAIVISASFKNISYEPVTSMVIGYKVENSTPVFETINFSTPITYNEIKTINFTSPYTSAIANYNTVKVFVSAINNTLSTTTNNDTVFGALTFASANANKKVLVQNYVSSSDGWSPNAQTQVQNIATTNTNVVAVSVHNNDNWQTQFGSMLYNDYATNYSTASIDETSLKNNIELAYDINELSSLITNRLTKPCVASVSLTNVAYDSITRQINANVEVMFLANMVGDYRVNLFVKENNVYGPLNDNTNNGYNQLSFMQSVPTSPYYNLGTYYNNETTILNASEYKQQMLLDTLFDGANGSAIPALNLVANSVYSKNYSYTLPLSTQLFKYNADNIYLIAVVSEFSSNVTKREILNVTETKLTTKPELLVGIKQNQLNKISLNVYPNPAADNLFIKLDDTQSNYLVEIVDIVGNSVYQSTINGKAHINVSKLNAGNYFIKVSDSASSVVKKLIIVK